MLLVSVAALGVLGIDAYLGDGVANRWGRTDGIALLLLFTIFLYYTTRAALSVVPSEMIVRPDPGMCRPRWRDCVRWCPANRRDLSRPASGLACWSALGLLRVLGSFIETFAEISGFSASDRVILLGAPFTARFRGPSSRYRSRVKSTLDRTWRASPVGIASVRRQGLVPACVSAMRFNCCRTVRGWNLRYRSLVRRVPALR